MNQLGIDSIVHDITDALSATGCYAMQIEAIRSVFPSYGEGYLCKLTLPPILNGDRLNVSHLIIRKPSGEEETVRLTPSAYRQLVAATSYKQRLRKTIEYYHADRLNYAVSGTPNRLEYDQGFFVKQGDGTADFKPIVHLYKTQVYDLAEYMSVPEEIRTRPPMTDTYSMPQTQEEFYFSLPHEPMDLCLYAFSHGVPATEVAEVLHLTSEQVERVYKDIQAKRRTTRYQHMPALTVESIN